MRLRKVAACGVAVVALAASGCAASYEDRMKYLDEIAQKGIDYRAKLYEQKTEPSTEACKIGFDLLKANPPQDQDGGGTSSKWKEQVEEAYIKSCVTGELKPKPDVEGVDAVTPVPVTAPPGPSGSPSASASPAT
ncbi:hypothetical protein [Micromonospora sp. S4605]|uniref:hypothetical protein n=1 Tax=Micromonospora sp. S4605 TaxID=1420897 RepID=UPI0011B77A89|nr:hypothetical protein [Micromonospora sp. S4605]